MYTGVNPAINLSSQRIHPYTDLLLHDMGAGLADNRPDYLATGSEWRTTLLWGLGCCKRPMAAAAYFLHDGRAQTIEEAILWHGGRSGKVETAVHATEPGRPGGIAAISVVFVG